MSQELEKKNSKVLRNLSLPISQAHTLPYLKKPLISMLICYTAGVIFQNQFRYFYEQWLFLFCFIVLMTSLLSFKKNWNITSFLLFLFFLLIGMLNTSYHLHPHGFQDIGRFEEEKGFVLGKISQIEIKQDRFYQEIQVNVNSFQSQGIFHQAKGLILLRIYDNQQSFQYGDLIKAEVLLTKPALPGNFGEMNYRDYLARQNIFFTDSIESNQLQITGHSQEINFFSVIQNMKDKIIRNIDQIYSIPARGLIKAILTGDRTDIPQEWIKLFQDAGVMHILAISGLHVGILGMAIFFFFKLIPGSWLKNTYRYLIAVLILLGYAAMTGFCPSASRATVMFIIILIARLINRPYHIYNSIYLAALLLLLWQPLYLFDAGFLLSFLVTFFIIYLSPIIEEKCSFLPEFLNKSLSVSLSAWLGMAPLSVYFFYKISFIAILSNIFIVPLIGIILVLALLSISLSFLFLPLALSVSAFNQVLVSVLLFIGKELSLLPFAYQYFGQPGIYFIVLYYLIVFVIFYTIYFWPEYNFLQKKKSFWMTSILILILVIIPVITNSSSLTVHFINVGEGDCILIQTPQKKNILIDGGGTPFTDFDVGKNIVIPYLRRNGINQINLMILTHPDLDHLEGLIAILKEMKVHLVIDSGIESSHQTYAEFLYLIRENDDMNYFQAEAGDIILFEEDLEFLVLNPIKTFLLNHVENHFNNHSIVLKLRYKKSTFLFTGDIEEIAENNLLLWGNALKSDILKVAHHGSNTSSTNLFIEAVQPSVAVVSVGHNQFGHPHREIVKRLEEGCYKLFRTDLNGTVLIKSDGNECNISTLR